MRFGPIKNTHSSLKFIRVQRDFLVHDAQYWRGILILDKQANTKLQADLVSSYFRLIELILDSVHPDREVVNFLRGADLVGGTERADVLVELSAACLDGFV